MLGRIDRDARNRFRRRSSAIVLVVVLVLAGTGVWYQHWKAEKGPSEPMCLALTSQDVQPLLGKPKKVSEDASTLNVSEDASPSPTSTLHDIHMSWTCAVHGDSQTLFIQVTSQADRALLNYKVPGVPVVETIMSQRGGVSRDVPGTSAKVISWVQGGDAHAGWFDGQSAATIATWDTDNDQEAAAYTDTLADLVTRRAPQLFAATGYPPSSTPTPTP